jgi:hypothetical protein
MEDEAKRDEHLFIVRTWREVAAGPDWKVSVLHVPSGLRLATSKFRDLDDFIRLRLERGAKGD